MGQKGNFRRENDCTGATLKPDDDVSVGTLNELARTVRPPSQISGMIGHAGGDALNRLRPRKYSRLFAFSPLPV